MPDFTTYKPPNIKPSIKSFFLPNISANYMTLCFSNMNDNKSVPRDSVPIKYLKMSNLIIAPILSYLINLCVIKVVFLTIQKSLKLYQFLSLVKNDKSLQLSFNFFAKSCFQNIWKVSL